MVSRCECTFAFSSSTCSLSEEYMIINDNLDVNIRWNYTLKSFCLMMMDDTYFFFVLMSIRKVF